MPDGRTGPDLSDGQEEAAKHFRLAEELGRNRGSVTRDVNKLKSFGLLRLREQVNLGHVVVQIVEPVAQKFQMRVAVYRSCSGL